MRNERNDSGPIKDGGVPVLNHRSLGDVEYDERESVNKCRDEASVRYPSMEDLQFLVADACKRSDQVALACGSKNEW